MKFLPTVFPSLFFFVHATLEIHAAGQNLHNTLDHLDRMFPGSSTVKGMRALVHYHVRGERGLRSSLATCARIDKYISSSQSSRKLRDTLRSYSCQIRSEWKILIFIPTSCTSPNNELLLRN